MFAAVAIKITGCIGASLLITKRLQEPRKLFAPRDSREPLDPYVREYFVQCVRWIISTVEMFLQIFGPKRISGSIEFIMQLLVEWHNMLAEIDHSGYEYDAWTTGQKIWGNVPLSIECFQYTKKVMDLQGVKQVVDFGCGRALVSSLFTFYLNESPGLDPPLPLPPPLPPPPPDPLTIDYKLLALDLYEGGEVKEVKEKEVKEKELVNVMKESLNKFTKVTRGSFHELALATTSSTTKSLLILFWPPGKTDMGYWALKSFAGNLLLLSGDDDGGVTGSDAMFALLRKEWILLKSFGQVSCAKTNTAIYLYQRRGAF